jgi:hypothetical protein
MDDKALMAPKDILNHVSTFTKGKLKWKLDSLPEEMLQLSAEELEKDQVITNTDQKLRLTFHQELQRAANENDTVIVTNICKGICHPNSFLLKIEDPKKLAWMILPYENESLRINHQVIKAQDAMEELLNLNIYYTNANGIKILDHKAAELKYKVAKLIYDRAYPATQKVAYTTDNSINKDDALSIEEKIKMLEEKLKTNE